MNDAVIKTSAKPIICLITPGRLTDENFVDDAPALLSRLSRAARCGVDLIQIREKNVSASRLVEFVRSLMGETSGTQCRVVVNERFDVSVVSGAHGVHLTSTSIPGPVVRSSLPSGFIIGKSVHSLQAVEDARAFADYVFFSPIFETPSKIGIIEAKGIGQLGEAVRLAASMPVIALGGITLKGLKQIAESGAAGIAGISLFDVDELEATLDLIGEELR